MKKAALQEKIKILPKSPGVYLFKNNKDIILYVGKAKRLRDRVGSYFILNITPGTKTARLVNQISDFDYVEVETEIEALVLEALLIKKHKPKYNINLKDDKTAICVIIRNETVKKRGKVVKLPRVLLLHANEIKKGDTTFGPYPHGAVARALLYSIRKIFLFRDCSRSKFDRYTKLDTPCFYGHIGVCIAPCVEAVSVKEYRKNIKLLKDFLSGRSTRMVKAIEKEMYRLSKEQRYEDAAGKRDYLQKIRYITQGFRSPEEYMDNPYLIEDLIAGSLDSLVSVIPSMKKLPRRIECYDISNLIGKDATGGMVVMTDGRINRKEYRKFRIKFKHTPDDYEMMREVFRRRFKREKSKNENIKKWGLPDLIVVDGGKGQVSAALDVLEEYGLLNISVIGITKRYEEIILSDFSTVTLSRGDLGLKLVQKMRDEAHRFARKYHLQLRLRSLRTS